MKQLPTEFTEKGYRYKQERRGDHCSLYRQQWHEEGSIAWEVVIPQIRKQTFLDGKWQPCEPYEGYPSTSQWGDQAWTFADIERAVAKFHEVNENRAQSINSRAKNASSGPGGVKTA